MQLPGTPSDDVDGVLAAGRGDIGTLFVSMARRHPDGRDAEYLRWHTLDHRPEQHRLSGVRASLRLVSTPACRSARARERRALRRDRPRDDVLLHRPERADGFPRTLQGARRRGPEAAAAAAGRARRLRGAAASRPRRGSRSAPTCCRGGRSAGRVPAAGDGRDVAADARRRRRRRRASGRRRRRTVDAQPGECAGRPDASRTASSTTTRSRPRNGCGRSSTTRWSRPGVEPLLAAPFLPRRAL